MCMASGINWAPVYWNIDARPAGLPGKKYGAVLTPLFKDLQADYPLLESIVKSNAKLHREIDHAIERPDTIVDDCEVHYYTATYVCHRIPIYHRHNLSCILLRTADRNINVHPFMKLNSTAEYVQVLKPLIALFKNKILPDPATTQFVKDSANNLVLPVSQASPIYWMCTLCITTLYKVILDLTRHDTIECTSYHATRWHWLHPIHDHGASAIDTFDEHQIFRFPALCLLTRNFNLQMFESVCKVAAHYKQVSYIIQYPKLFPIYPADWTHPAGVVCTYDWYLIRRDQSSSNAGIWQYFTEVVSQTTMCFCREVAQHTPSTLSQWSPCLWLLLLRRRMLVSLQTTSPASTWPRSTHPLSTCLQSTHPLSTCLQSTCPWSTTSTVRVFSSVFDFAIYFSQSVYHICQYMCTCCKRSNMTVALILVLLHSELDSVTLELAESAQ